MSEQKEVGFIEVIKDLQARVTALETEVRELRQQFYRSRTTGDYDEIYKEVMKRTARDLKVNYEPTGKTI